MIVSTYLENGFFAGFYNSNEVPTNRQIATKNYENNFVKAKWNGTQWIEVATPEEIIASIRPSYLQEIYEIVDKLSFSAKERALGKVGDNLTKEQLEKLEKRYLVKKEVAERVVSNLPIQNEIIYNLIDFEQENDFAGEKLIQTIHFLNSTYNASIPIDTSRIVMYCNLILAKYQIGRTADDLFTNLIEYFRSKMITWLDNGQFDKIEEGKLIIFTINSTHNNTDILNLKTQFDQI